MESNADKQRLITVGEKDYRITRLGYFLRKYKLDEFPQLINILKGDMSFVGPRPEVKKYVDLYTEEQRKILSVRPGMTSLASIEFINENEILGKSDNPEYTYMHEIIPTKLNLDIEYVTNWHLRLDMIILFRTIKKLVGK